MEPVNLTSVNGEIDTKIESERTVFELRKSMTKRSRPDDELLTTITSNGGEHNLRQLF